MNLLPPPNVQRDGAPGVLILSSLHPMKLEMDGRDASVLLDRDSRAPNGKIALAPPEMEVPVQAEHIPCPVGGAQPLGEQVAQLLGRPEETAVNLQHAGQPVLVLDCGVNGNWHVVASFGVDEKGYH